MNAAGVEHKGGKWVTYLFKYGVPLIITAGLCYLLFRDIDYHEMLETIRRDCDFRYIGVALGLSVFSHVFRGMRWGLQLRALGIKPPLWVLVLSIFGTYAVNLVFPRLGEVWRTAWISQRQRAPFSTVFGSMVADRLADTITVLLLTVMTFVLASGEISRYLSQNTAMYHHVMDVASSPWLWCGVVAVVSLICFGIYRFRHSAIVGKLHGFVKGLWGGFVVILKMPHRLTWLLLTVALWGCYYLQLYVAFFAFPLTAEVVTQYGALAVLVCFVLSSISMGVPSNGGIGPWQWSIIFGLSMYASTIPGLDKEYATSFANLVMGCQTLLLILLGIITFAAVAIDRRHHADEK